MASMFKEQMAVDDLGNDRFISHAKPCRRTGTSSVAYGGCTISVGMQAASHTIPREYFPYSVTGNFLSAALAEGKLRRSVHRIRDTKTFATRLVKIGQDRDDGVPRDCMVMIVDYQAKEEISVLDYSAPPTTTHVSPEECIDIMETIEVLEREGTITEELAQFCRATSRLYQRVLGDTSRA